MDRPTKKQQELLQFIGDFIREHGYGPSYREIMNGMHYKSVSTVAVHVDGLIARGWLQKKTHSARSLEITSPHVATSAVSTADTKTPSAKRSPDQQIVAKCDELLAENNEPTADLVMLVEALRILGYAEQYATYQQKLKRRQEITYNKKDEVSE